MGLAPDAANFIFFLYGASNQKGWETLVWRAMNEKFLLHFLRI